MSFSISEIEMQNKNDFPLNIHASYVKLDPFDQVDNFLFASGLEKSLILFHDLPWILINATNITLFISIERDYKFIE